MSESPNLALPWLAAAQAQKHVTVNEALRRLDALVQITVESAALAAPPAAPAEGQRWIVGSSPTDAWTGQAGRIAAWGDVAWTFFAPLDGWTAWDRATAAMLVWNTATGSWAPLITGSFPDDRFSLLDNLDPTKKVQFQLAGLTTGTTRTLALPNADTTLAGLGLAQTFTAATTFSGTFTASGATASLGTSTATSTASLGSGATASGNTKTVNIGTAGVAGSTTNVTLGSAVAGALGTLTVNSPTVTFAGSVSTIAMASANVAAAQLGLGGATADATNRLSLNAPASLFNHAGAGHQVKLNKATAADTGSILFQTGFSGRAEIGLAGSDDLQVKVSADGATWFNALQLDRASGRLRLFAGLQLIPAAGDPGAPVDGDLWYNATTGRFRGRQGGVSVDLVEVAPLPAWGVLQANHVLASTIAAQKLFNWSANGALTLATGTWRFSCSLLITAMSTTSGSAKFDLKGAGTAAIGKMSMQDFGGRGSVAAGAASALSGSASDLPSSTAGLTTAVSATAMRASIHGLFEITSAGTIIPSIALDVAAAAIVNAGSGFECSWLGPVGTPGGSWS